MTNEDDEMDDPLSLLLAHHRWAGDRQLRVLEQAETPPGDAVRRVRHILAAESLWLDRIEGREHSQEVWPEAPDVSGFRTWMEDNVGRSERIVDALNAGQLPETVRYVDPRGVAYESRIDEILMHVWMHAQYHRGQIALLLREAGIPPGSTDLMSWLVDP